jgi:hypothetical protein
MRLRGLGEMGCEEHHRELATFLAFRIEAVAQVADLLVLIPEAEGCGFQLHAKGGGFPVQA